MENAHFFRDKLAAGKTLLGTCITFVDAAISESLADIVDFVWIDTEHNPLSLERVQGHIMATKASEAVPLVRVPVNDPAVIKPILDIGAAGVIVPLVKTVDDVRRAVAACRYPPEGVRGFAPRRPSGYGARGGPEFCKLANETVITIVQIEQAEALANLPEILKVPGLTSVVVGPNDLAASLGYTGQPRHPEVHRAIDTVIAAGCKANIPVGLATGFAPDELTAWADKGVNWMAIGADFILLRHTLNQLTKHVREHREIARPRIHSSLSRRFRSRSPPENRRWQTSSSRPKSCETLLART